MELKNLLSFVTVADVGNFTEAARRLNTTQSSISRHIKLLEDELRTTLFERSTSEVAITESGKIFLRRARNIIKEAKESKEEISCLKGELCGELHIGVGSFIAPYIRKASIEFLKRYPKVLLHAQFDHSHVLNNGLRNGAIMSKRNRLADKDILSFDDLMQSKIIMPNVGERIFQTFQRYTPHDISKLPVSCIVSSASEALMVLNELDFITFLPSDYIITSHNLVAKPIETLDVELKSNAHWLKDKPMKASAKAFMDIVKEITS